MSHTLRRPATRGAPKSLVLAPLEPRPFETQERPRLARVTRIATGARRRLRLSETALAEQKLLAREADHRVANALQLVHGTLSLQAAAAPEGKAREAIRAAARSIAAAAEAHRHLYGSSAARSTTDTGPDAAAYLGGLIRKLSPTSSPGCPATGRGVTLRAESGSETAVPAGLLPRLGLITAELITNALKHGAGPVLVELRPAGMDEGGGVVLAVSDQGSGFPANFHPAANRGGSLGMRLLVTLARPGRVWVDPADRRRILVQLRGS